MPKQRRVPTLIIFVMIAMVALIVSCSDDPTGPTGGNQAKELDSGNIPSGGVYVHTFATTGTFNYHCTIHGGMTGSVIVVAGSADSALVAIIDNAFTPTTSTVKPGGAVRWINGGSTHTVTSP